MGYIRPLYYGSIMTRLVFCIRIIRVDCYCDVRDRSRDIVFMHFLTSRSFDFFVIQFFASENGSFERFPMENCALTIKGKRIGMLRFCLQYAR